MLTSKVPVLSLHSPVFRQHCSFWLASKACPLLSKIFCVAAAADNKLTGNWETQLKLQLKNLTKSGKLVKPAGKNTYKLGEALKKDPKKKAVSSGRSGFHGELQFEFAACSASCSS